MSLTFIIDSSTDRVGLATGHNLHTHSFGVGSVTELHDPQILDPSCAPDTGMLVKNVDANYDSDVQTYAAELVDRIQVSHNLAHLSESAC